MQNFQALGALLPHPRASGGWGLCPQTPSLWQLEAPPPDPQISSPLLRISGYALGFSAVASVLRRVFKSIIHLSSLNLHLLAQAYLI